MATVKIAQSMAHNLSTEEARELFEVEAERTLGISGAEFIRRWEAGNFEDANDPGVTWLLSLLPLARS